MTPFEAAKTNIEHIADGLALMGLIAQTIEETKEMEEEETELIWVAILALVGDHPRFDGDN